jgi:hypothetical protein
MPRQLGLEVVKVVNQCLGDGIRVESRADAVG